ncbi:DNA helicase [Roseibium marinum]|uniref:DnaB helicase-like protein n=1 Tax=Roseibium marinum TaxID=281252 RepID=A0A2S3URH1_9HYPH|nr:DNA helicase [Roseibium marinum]POF30160.1 DnaB helicase-like protein [Roseibium marinum]
MTLSAPVFQLKRRAKLLARQENIPLSTALDRIARQEGFAHWSLLAARLSGHSPSRVTISRLENGDLALLGARPGQGKTLMGLRLLLDAAREGRKAVLFSLEFTEKTAREYLANLGDDPRGPADRLSVVTSEDISSDFIMEYLDSAPSGTIALIDYLQILDQRRSKPDLAVQVRSLRAFARQRGIILAFLSQIDRSYDPGVKPLPDMEDIRLPNRLDLSLFSKAWFLHGGKVRFQSAP